MYTFHDVEYIPRQLITITEIVYIIKFDKGACARMYGRKIYDLIFQNYAVDREPLFCTFSARAQNV